MKKILFVLIQGLGLFFVFAVFFGVFLQRMSGHPKDLLLIIAAPVIWSSFGIASVLYLFKLGRLSSIFLIPKFRWSQILWFFLLNIVLFAGCFLDHLRSPSETKLSVSLGVAIAMTFVGPLSEELYFRGILCDYLCNRMNTYLAVIIQGAVFAVIHISTSNPITSGLITFFSTLIIGSILGAVYVESKSVFVCYLMHAYYNFALFFYMQNVRYIWFRL